MNSVGNQKSRLSVSPIPSAANRAISRPCSASYIPQKDYFAYAKNRATNFLGSVLYADDVPLVNELPDIVVPMKQLSDTVLYEVLETEDELKRISMNGLEGLASEHVVMASYMAADVTSQNLSQKSEEAYKNILKFIQDAGYPHLIRVWNYMPLINDETGGLERYKQFCLGRHEALYTIDQSLLDRLPSASALGTRNGHLQVYFLASKIPGQQKENPRQVSAYKYPPQYGPRSPSFARAILQRWKNSSFDLYISGTASIIGHESCYPEDVRQQLLETLRNIDVLVESASSQEKYPIRSTDQLSLLKIYIRHPEHYELVRDILESEFKVVPPAMYLQADICRTNLLLEIEGIYHSPT